MICFHILKVKAETGATERRREAVTKTSEEDHDREKVKNRKKVIVYEAYPKNGKKIFDDSRKVDLEVRAQWEGGKPDAEAADLVVCGYAVSKNVGIWRVDVEYEIAGTDADAYVLECRKAALETKVEIVPKILQVSISDANKGYFADNKTENLRFSDEKNAIQISGFMKNGEASNQPPVGFVMPKVWIDENVLQKDSPIYQNGQYLVYQGALTLKEEVAGKNANYCYAPEDKRYTAKGNVILEETDPNPENIKIRARYGKCVYDSKRKVYRISKGAILEAQPTKGSGYNQTNVSQPLYGEGRWSFVMERRQKNGELQARSKKTEISYEVDEEAAEVVRYIFRLRSEGYGYCSIVKILNEKGIKSPSAYRYEKGIVRNEKGSNVLWKIYAIEDMLRDEVYLGNMVRGKTHSAMHKGEKRHYVPRAEWVIVPGTHEPIVSKELFEAVQAVNEKKAQEHKDNLEKAKENPKRDNLFKGKIFCGDCGITMGGAVGNYNSMSYYCPNYRENGAMGCVKKHISARKLEKAVLEAVQIHLKIFLEGREEIRSRNGSAEIGKRRMVLESETRDLRQKEAQYQQKLSSTYLDYKDKLLTVQEYFMLKNKYQAALAELEVARKEKELLLNKMQETYGEDLELSHAAEKYFGQMVVTKDMVDALIERIEVFAKGRIHIIFRFEDEYRSLLEKRADMEQEGAN